MTIDIFGEYDVPIYPDIAVNPDGSNNDITDPTSGQPNVSTPASPIPLDGWPGNGIPIFSDFNKLFRMITQWIRWFYDHIVNTTDVNVSNAQGDILALESAFGVGTGSITADTATSQYMTISLPTGFTHDNCYVVGGWLTNPGNAIEQIALPSEYRQSDKRVYTFHDVSGSQIMIHIQWADGFGSRTVTASVLLKKI